MKIKKTFTFSDETIIKLKKLSENEDRSNSNMLEVLVNREFELVNPKK